MSARHHRDELERENIDTHTHKNSVRRVGIITQLYIDSLSLSRSASIPFGRIFHTSATCRQTTNGMASVYKFSPPPPTTTGGIFKG